MDAADPVDGPELRALLERMSVLLHRPGVVSAYLFGSFAEGREHRESDVDVGVLLERAAFPTESLRFQERVDLSSELLTAARGRQVDVVILNDAPPLLGARIVVEGRLIVRNDPEADHAYVRDVQLRAADLAPFIARGRRRLLEELGR